MKIKIVSFAFVFLVFVAFGQKKPSILFESKVYNFGQIKEENGPQKCRFNFTNVGTDTLKLTAVRASCGCTTSSYTKDPIPPGGKGYIEAVYNPANRPGAFNKAITVTTNDPDNPTIVLSIKGEVIPKPKTKADYYPQHLGNLYFVTNHLAFGDLYDTKTKTDTLKFYNNSKQDITLTIKDVKPFLKIELPKTTLKPEEEGKAIVTYLPKERKEYGYVFDQFYLNTNDPTQPDKIIYVSANIMQDFSWMTEKDKKNAPKIVFKDSTTYDFGTIKQGEKVEHSFTFTNQGKNPLQILKVKASCGCTAVEPSKKEVKKGETSEIKAIFHSSGRKGPQYKTITVITNDPDHSNITLVIKGNVE